MKKIESIYRRPALQIFCLIILLSLAGCSLFADSGEDDSLKETQIALGIQQTMSADQGLSITATAQQATLDAQSIPPTAPEPALPTPDLAATQIEQSIQQTAMAQPTPEAPTEEIAPTSTEAISPVDFENMMKSASIVLYEDIVNDPQVFRFVKRTLDSMDLNYKDDGSAKGWFKEDLLVGAPDGEPWDLIIAATEYRAGIQGEFFEYINDALNQGSSVILETWHLDQIHLGKAALILGRCGIDIRNYVGKSRMPTDLVVWPISGVSHPILNEPNSGLSFTNPNPYWPYADLGDLMSLTGNGDAQLLMGTTGSDNSHNGVLAVCLDGQLTLQTFSSHNFYLETMMPLWENMIYNALKVRLLGSQ